MLIANVVSWEINKGDHFSAQAILKNDSFVAFDPISLDLILKYPKNYHIDAELLSKSLLRHSLLSPTPFVLLSVDKKEENIDPDLIESQISYILQPQLPGNYDLTFYEISFFPNNAADKAEFLYSKLFNIAILAIANEKVVDLSPQPLMSFSPYIPLELSNENKKIMDVRTSAYDAVKRHSTLIKEKEIPWGAILMLILVIFWILADKRSHPHKVLDSNQNLKSNKKSLDLIDQLLKKYNNNPSELSSYYCSLTDISRNYINERHHLKTISATTPEFINEIDRYLLMDANMKLRIKSVLLRCDLVKFGGYTPNEEDFINGIATAKDLINEGSRTEE